MQPKCAIEHFQARNNIMSQNNSVTTPENHTIFISVAPNGARKTKEEVPTIPITPEELAEEAFHCQQAGAVLFHLHIRDKEQRHILDANQYAETIAAIKERVGHEMVIQTTTEAVGIYNTEQQIALVEKLMPEAASMALREFIPTPDYEASSCAFFNWASKQGIFIQYILYSPEELTYYLRLKQEGKIAAHNDFVLLVLGKKHAKSSDASAYARPDDLTPFLQALQQHQDTAPKAWAVCAFGGYELDCMTAAAHHGGHVRIGFENNHLLHNQSYAPTNAALLTQFTEEISKKPHFSISDYHNFRSFFHI